MKRSYRDAIVGFTILGGVVIFSGLTIWLEGWRVGRNQWNISATFDNANGLSEGTPVTFRGIKVGSIDKVSFDLNNVKTKIKLNDNLILFKPVRAKVLTSSVLGRDMEVSLISDGFPQKGLLPLSTKTNCPKDIIVCEGDTIKGEEIKSISSLTEKLNKLLSQAGEEGMIEKMVESISQFDETQKELKDLIRLSKDEMNRAKPIITELKKSVSHVNNILGTIDNQETLENIKMTASSMRSTTEKLDKLASELSELFGNEEFKNAIESAAIGIGKLFNDLYP